MKKIIASLAVGLIALACAGTANAATGIKPEVKVNEKVTNLPSQQLFNVTIQSFDSRGGALGTVENYSNNYGYVYFTGNVFTQELYDAIAAAGGNTSLLPAIGQELSAAYLATLGIAANPSYNWTNIFNIIDIIIPGRTAGIAADGEGDQINWDFLYGYNNKNGYWSFDYCMDKFNQFLQDHKTTVTTSVVSESTSYAYEDGKLVAVTTRDIQNQDIDIFNIAVQKYCSPIVLNLSGNGKLQASGGNYLPHNNFDDSRIALVDFYGDGFEMAMEWVGPQDGLLVAPKADGTVDMSCLFGTAGGYENGYEKLSLYADKDGIVRGENLNKLAVWQDVNGNAKVDAGELKSCKDLGITSINANHKMFASTFEMNGKTQKMWDWWPSAAELHKVASK